MTASKTPWTTKHDSGGCYVLDRDGEVISHYYDWRDAEFAVAQVNAAMKGATPERQHLITRPVLVGSR